MRWLPAHGEEFEFGAAVIREEIGASWGLQQKPAGDDEFRGSGYPMNNMNPRHEFKEQIHRFLYALRHLHAVLQIESDFTHQRRHHRLIICRP